MAAGFNIDTIAITGRLYQDKELRDTVAAAGLQYAHDASASACAKLPAEKIDRDPACASMLTLAKTFGKREQTFGKLPFGWADQSETSYWLQRVAGWLLTALALMLGGSVPVRSVEPRRRRPQRDEATGSGALSLASGRSMHVDASETGNSFIGRSNARGPLTPTTICPRFQSDTATSRPPIRPTSA